MMAQKSLSNLIKFYIISILIIPIVFSTEVDNSIYDCNRIGSVIGNVSGGIPTEGGAEEDIFSNGTDVIVVRQGQNCGSGGNALINYNKTLENPRVNNLSCIPPFGSQIRARSATFGGGTDNWWVGYWGTQADNWDLAEYGWSDLTNPIRVHNASCQMQATYVGVKANSTHTFLTCSNRSINVHDSSFNIVENFPFPFTFKGDLFIPGDVSEDGKRFITLDGYDELAEVAQIIIFNRTSIITKSNVSLRDLLEKGADPPFGYFVRGISFDGENESAFYIIEGEGRGIYKSECDLVCTPPPSGDWNIQNGADCTINVTDSITGNLNISNGSLEIQDSGILTVSGGFAYIYPGSNLTIVGQING